MKAPAELQDDDDCSDTNVLQVNNSASGAATSQATGVGGGSASGSSMSNSSSETGTLSDSNTTTSTDSAAAVAAASTTSDAQAPSKKVNKHWQPDTNTITGDTTNTAGGAGLGGDTKHVVAHNNVGGSGVVYYPSFHDLPGNHLPISNGDISEEDPLVASMMLGPEDEAGHPDIMYL